MTRSDRIRDRDVVRWLARRLGADDGLPIDPDLDPSDPGEPARQHRPAGRHVRRVHRGLVLAVATGGFLGALARYETELAWPVHGGHFPMSTFVINTSGAFLLGLTLTATLLRVGTWQVFRFFACVGVLGAWTTMSTVAVEADTLVRSGSVGTAALYLIATLVCGVAAAATGTVLGRLRRRSPASAGGEVMS